MSEYRMDKVAKGICYVFMVILLSIAVVLFSRLTRATDAGSALILLIPGVFVLALAFYLFREIQVMLVTLDDYALTQRTVFSSWSIPLKDLDGYRQGEKDVFFLIPKEGKRRQLSRNIANRKELIEWISEHYPDIDAREREAEEEGLLEDERFGSSREDREGALARARQMARAGTIGGFMIGVWFAIYPNPYDLVLALDLLVPLVAVFLIWHSKGLIRFYSAKRSPYPSVGLMIGAPVFAAVLRTLMAYNLYDFPSHAWTILFGGMTGITLATAFVAGRAITEEKKKALVVVMIMLTALAYSYGGIINTNCHYDLHPQNVWPVEVTGKHVSKGKSTTYHLEVSAWGKYAAGNDIDVGKSFYNSVQVHDSVNVVLMPGHWGIPWYFVVGQ